jgi:hypothetical protein
MEVEGMSSRVGARHLNCGKTTLADARKALADGTFDSAGSDGSITLDFRGSAVPTTQAEITKALESRGITSDAYNVSQGFSIFDSGDQVKNAFRATATLKKALNPVEELNIDPIELLKDLRAGYDSFGNPPIVDSLGDDAFVFSLNDTQFGKGEGGGTPATLERIEKAIAGAIVRIAQLRAMGFKLDTLVLIGGGDIVEGCTIFPNQSFTLDLDRRGQINTAVATIMNVLDRLGPYFEEIKVLACKGNHGENRIMGKRVNQRDNDDVLVFEMAKIAYDRDKVIGDRIEWIIADDHVGVTIKVAGWVLGTTHGDELGTGKYAFQKVFESMKRWALGRMPMGKCDVIVTHHYHHEQSANFGAWEWLQTRAQDGGSKWFESTTGMYSEPGSLTFVMTPDTRVSEVLYV